MPSLAPLTSPNEIHKIHVMKTLQLITLIAALSLTAVAAPLTPAKEATQGIVLQARMGQLVELRLKSGEKISGKVASVGDALVHLTTLTGLEMFEATVTLSDISAVVVRSVAK
jgi:hypothetical protein